MITMDVKDPLMPRVIACLVFAILVVGPDLAYSQARDDLLFVSNFDSNNFQPVDETVDGWSVVAVSDDHAVMTAANAREPSKGVRLYLEKDLDYSSVNGNGSDKPRVNLSKYSLKFDYDTDYWLGWSTYIPDTWIDDYSTNWTTIMQLKQPIGGSPILSLNIKGDTWEFVNRRDDANITFDENTTDVSVVYSGSTANDKGRWVDFVVNFRLCESANCDGKLTIWKGDEVIVDQNGPNAYVRSVVDGGPFLTLNLYKHGWKKKESMVDTREIYFDAIRIGGANSDYASVAPSGDPGGSQGVRPNPPTIALNAAE